MYIILNKASWIKESLSSWSDHSCFEVVHEFVHLFFVFRYFYLNWIGLTDCYSNMPRGVIRISCVFLAENLSEDLISSAEGRSTPVHPPDSMGIGFASTPSSCLGWVSLCLHGKDNTHFYWRFPEVKPLLPTFYPPFHLHNDFSQTNPLGTGIVFCRYNARHFHVKLNILQTELYTFEI